MFLCNHDELTIHSDFDLEKTSLEEQERGTYRNDRVLVTAEDRSVEENN
jgi:hypothetical protein